MERLGARLTLLPQYSRNLLEFPVSLPEEEGLEELVAQDGWLNHTCIFNLQQDRLGEIFCHMTVRSVMGRILPNCNQERGGRLSEIAGGFREGGVGSQQVMIACEIF